MAWFLLLFVGVCYCHIWGHTAPMYMQYEIPVKKKKCNTENFKKKGSARQSNRKTDRQIEEWERGGGLVWRG